MGKINFRIFYFSVRVWLTSVLVAPALFMVIQAYIDSLNHTYANPTYFEPGMYLFMVVFELVTTFIIWLVFWAITEAIVYCIGLEELQRWLIFVTGLLLTIVPFMVLVGFPVLINPRSDMFIPMLANAVCIGCGCWFYRLR